MKENKRSAAVFYRKYGIALILIILFVASALVNHNFLKPRNLINILTQISVVTIIACGEEMLIVSGLIDLSAGLGFGALCGWINGFLVTRFKLQAFIATLAMTNVVKGAVQLYTNGQAISGVDKIEWLGHYKVAGAVPLPVVIMLVSVAVIAILMKHTSLGLLIYSIGGNEKATIASGINTNRTKRIIFTLSSLLTGLAGVVLLGRLVAGMPSVGEGYEFDAITAVVVGGTSFLGGIGSVTGALIGSIIVGLINNILNLLHVSTQYQLIVKGVLIAGAVIIDTMTKEDKKSQ